MGSRTRPAGLARGPNSGLDYAPRGIKGFYMPILQNRDACQKGLAIHTALQHCVTAQFIDPNTQPAYFKVCDYGKVVRHFIKRSEHVGGCGIIGPYVYRNVKV